VGYLIHACKDDVCLEGCPEPVVILCTTFDAPDQSHEEPECDEIFTVPRAWVQRIRYLTGGPRANRKAVQPSGETTNGEATA